MTPFDGAALLAMLRAFYPVVSAAALATARRDRPEYFAGGTLIGSKGDKLQLGDGRVFDLIFAAGGAPGQQRWQVLADSVDTGAAGEWTEEAIVAWFRGRGVEPYPTSPATWRSYWLAWGWKDPPYFLARLEHADELVAAGLAEPWSGPEPGDGLELEPGPLTPLDPEGFGIVDTGPSFEALLGESLGELGDVDGALGAIQETPAASSLADDLDATFHADLMPALEEHTAIRAALDADDPSELLDESNAQGGTINQQSGEYDEPPPDDIHQGDPGDPPDPEKPDDPNRPPQF